MKDNDGTLEKNAVKKEHDFFDRPIVIDWTLRVFYFCCALLVIADLVVHRHIYTGIEKVFAFYAIYGFVACVVLVIIATQMRKCLMRDENYYDEVDPEDLGQLEGQGRDV